MRAARQHTRMARLAARPPAVLTAAALTAGMLLAGGPLAVPASAASAPVAAPARLARPAAAAARTRVSARVRTSAAPARLTVGGATLRRCGTRVVAYCGRIRVPLDYSRPAASPRIGIGFRWLPATAAVTSHGIATGRSTGTVLAVEGGPGYSSTGSQSLYRAMMGPLTRTRNLLLVNLRGTGSSTAINCPGLEHAGPAQHGAAFTELVAACGRRLNHTWRYRGAGGSAGSWVHASDLFNTAYSARDTAAVLRLLRPGRVDLYGDSYGTWFSQVFASRYAAQLRSVTLDSTYQVLGLDPWYTTTVVTARRAFDRACALSAACRAASRRPAWAQITALERRLARAPVRGATTSVAGTRQVLTVTPQTLVNLVNNAGFDPVVYRDLDAAARALLTRGYAAPLLRIAALSLGYDDTNEPLDGFSDGLFFAVSCTDYVQLFSRTAAPAVRARQYAAALRSEPPRTFAPFSVAQWTAMDQYTEAYSACLDWPAPTRLVRPITARPPLVPRRVPVLILSGTLDSLTPKLDGATVVARDMGPSARLVTVANLTHVTLQDGNDACPASIYQRFVAHPAGLATENTSCAARVTPVHAVGSYPRRLDQAVPAAARRGNTAGRQARRAASIALASVGDEISRYPMLDGSTDRGLLGGHVRFSGGTIVTIALHGARWVRGATIDGRARWNQSSGRVTARLTVHLRGAAAVHLTARWLVYGTQRQLARITGRQGSRRLAAVSPAP
jgi:pimeloyl-ACP methyl ester carboxylesterase